MIKVKSISKSFGDSKVLDDSSVTIQEGEVVAVIGPSGSGKSTFLRCINMIESPDDGVVEINSERLTSRSAKQIRSKIGMVFQSFNLFPHMNVLQNISYPQIKVLRKSKKDSEDTAKKFLTRVGLTGYESRYPSSISGGEKQRVAIARALAMGPSIMLFDEPTSALDPEMVSEVLDIIKGLTQTKMTMLIVTHEIKFAKEVADRIIFFDKGRVIEDLPTKKFFSSSKSERVKEFLRKVL